MPKSTKTFRALPWLHRVRSLSLAVLVGGALATLAPDADAAKVKGKVVGFQYLLNPVWVEAKDAANHLFSFREPVPTVRAEFRKLFPHIPKELCVAALAEEKQPAQKPILIRVGGGRTTPVTIVVTPGTQLQFQNTDPFTHKLYGVGIKTFLPSETVKGGVRSWTVPSKGSFEIRDEAAPSLRMFIIGEPNVVKIAYPSLKGQFVLTVPNDSAFRVQAYFAGKKVGGEQPVAVSRRDIDISKRPLVVAKKKKGDSSKKK